MMLERGKKKVAKSEEVVAKYSKTNRVLEAYHLVDQIQSGGERLADLTKEDVNEITWFVEEKRKAIARRKQVAQYAAAASASSFSLAPAPALSPDFWVPPPSPEEEIHLPQVGFSVEDDESNVPSLLSALNNLGLENHLGNKSDYAFALQDGDVGDQSGPGQGTELHQLDFGDDKNSSSPDIKMQFSNMEAENGSSDTSNDATGEGPVENLTRVDIDLLFPPNFFFP